MSGLTSPLAPADADVGPVEPAPVESALAITASVSVVWPHDGACAHFPGVPLGELGAKLADLHQTGGLVTWALE